MKCTKLIAGITAVIAAGTGTFAAAGQTSGKSDTDEKSYREYLVEKGDITVGRSEKATKARNVGKTFS